MDKQTEETFPALDADVPSAVNLLKKVKEHGDDVSLSVNNLLHKVQDGLFPTAKGISLLEVKNHMLISYLTDMTFLIWKKLNGQSIEGDPAIERLVECRTVLEKIKPIDQKLKYQIDKLVKTFKTGAINQDDPLRFKPNPDNLMSKLKESDNSGDEESEKDKKKGKLYIPPRIAAMHYDGDETEESRRRAYLERAKRNALSSSLIEELKGEYYEGPEEIRESSLHRLKEDVSAKDRTRYEEDHMTRLTLTKKEKRASRQVATVSNLKGLTHFQDISALDYGDDEELPRKKKKKLSTKKSFKRQKRKGGRKKF